MSIENFIHRGESEVRMPAEEGPEALDRIISHNIETGKHREVPVVSAFIVRHGETTEDKTDPNRSLTPEGRKQALEAAKRLIDQLNPAVDIIQLYDSGNERANKTIMLIAEKLAEAGFKFFKPFEMDKSGKILTGGGVRTTEEVKSKKYPRLEAAKISDAVKKQLADPKIQEELGIANVTGDKRILAWFAKDWESTEKPNEVADRVYEGMQQTKKLLPRLSAQMSPEQRIVVLAAGNQTMIDAVLTRATNISPAEREGGAANLEGFKVDFDLDEEPKVGVWGENIERQVNLAK